MFESARSPPAQREANVCAPPARIEGIIRLPPVLGLRTRSWLAALYSDQHLSAREISRVAAASRSGVLKALDRFAIPPHVDGHERIGHLPFGLDYLDHKLVTNDAEQATVRMMQEQRADGLTLREIAGKLNSMLMPTKQGGVWQANTVRVILARA